MLLIDDRAGSKELAGPLAKMGLPVELTRLEFGDVAFIGRGEKGADVSVGIEFKTLRELVQALRTERLQGFQLPGMRNIMGYDHCYLFFEGPWLYNKQGLLLRRLRTSNQFVPLEGQMTISELLKRVFVLHLRGGLNPWPTTSRQDTLSSIRDLYRTWTDKDLDQHKSHLGIYVAPGLVPVSDIRRTFKTFPGLGIAAAQAAEQYFEGNLALACAASVETWSNIFTTDEKGKPRRLGVKVAEVIWCHLHGGNK
jgi:hypothetical protein